jgi:hypothetical protein
MVKQLILQYSTSITLQEKIILPQFYKYKNTEHFYVLFKKRSRKPEKL